VSYVQSLDINHKAPVVASSEIVIGADPEVVWWVISDATNWPVWNPAVKPVNLGGPVEVGATFRWKAGPGSITSTVQEHE
jgi:Polyketide cyclase / dehydrase and lipid transport